MIVLNMRFGDKLSQCMSKEEKKGIAMNGVYMEWAQWEGLLAFSL